MKKVLTILTIAIIALITSNIKADMWQGDVDDLWSTGNNWTDDSYSGADVGVPDSSTDVSLLDAGANNPRVASSGAVANNIYLGKWGWDSTLTIDSAGSLHASDAMVLANEANLSAAVINNGQVTVDATVYFHLGKAVLTNSGTLTAAGMILGNTASSTSTVVNTGTMDINGWLYLSLAGSNSVFNMNGGVVNVTGKLEMPDPGIGHINLHGGVWTNAQIGLNGNGGYTIEVGDGEMYIAGDQTGALDYMISVDLITGEGSLTPYSSYDGTYTKLAAIPEPAIIGLISILGLSLLRRK